MPNSIHHEIKTHTLSLGNDGQGNVLMTFCYIPPCPQGFWMGSRYRFPDQQPVHRVLVPAGFWMGQTPVTQRQYALFKREHQNEFSGNPNHPAEKIDWHEGVAFCEWLAEGLQSNNGYPEGMTSVRLPLEAEWEYACRGGTESDYYSGDGESALRRVGWFGEEWNKGSTHAVGRLASNAYGLQDMHGNVWEWCLDRWDKRAYRRRVDGMTAEQTFQLAKQYGDTTLRVLRGGSWGYTAEDCRAAYSIGFWADFSLRDIGLRACLVPSPVQQES